MCILGVLLIIDNHDNRTGSPTIPIINIYLFLFYLFFRFDYNRYITLTC